MKTSTQQVKNRAWSELTQGNFLGEGGYGKVYLGDWQQQQVAIKVLQIKNLAVLEIDEVIDNTEEFLKLLSDKERD